MLVCNVSLLRRRAAIAADIAETATALDSPGTGNVVLATLVDDPASVREFVDAFLGQIMREAANAAATVNAGTSYAVAVAEGVTATDQITVRVPQVFAVTVTEAATAADTQSASSAVLPTTFNPVDRLNITLSNANLTGTGSGAGGAVRSIGSIGAGKYYFEYKYNTVFTNSMASGVALASYNLANVSNVGLAFPARSSGNITINNVATGSSLGAIPNGGVVGVAIDRPANLIWFRIAPSGNWNGSGTANPATGTGGLSISALSGSLYGVFIGLSGDVCTANFGASAFTGSVPSGFTSGLLA